MKYGHYLQRIKKHYSRPIPKKKSGVIIIYSLTIYIKDYTEITCKQKQTYDIMIYPIVVSKCLNIVPKTPMMFFQGGEINEVSERF